MEPGILSHCLVTSQEKEMYLKGLPYIQSNTCPQARFHGDIAIIDFLFDIVLNCLSNYLFFVHLPWYKIITF